jgi:SSS family solute:Na+ symporter
VNEGLASADYIILGGFFVVLLAVGIIYSSRMRNLRDFFSGGRQVPWWLAGISLYMTTFSAFAFVSYSALAYKYGTVVVAIWWLSIPGCLLSARFLASRWRRAATTSPVEYLETRFSPLLRQLFSWFGIPLIVLDDALKLFVIGTLTSVSTGFKEPAHVQWAIGICGIVIVIYTLMGGLWAVLITDFIQFVVMGVAVLVLAPLAWRRAGGAGPISEHLPANFVDITVANYSWAWLLSFGVVLALTFATKWPYVQRYYASRSDTEARRVGYLVAALTVVSPPLLFFPALAARTFLPEVADANQVYSMICRELLPVGMLGMMLAAMFSATMSMLSSDYNAVASVITNDILKRVLLRNASDRVLIAMARLSTFAVGLIAVILAMLFARAEHLQELVDYMAQLFSALLPPVALPMVAGLLSKRTSNAGALLGFILGAVTGATAYFVSYREGFEYLRSVPYLTWTTVTPTAIGLVLGSVISPNSEPKQAGITQFLDGLRSQPHESSSLIETGDAALALRIIGATTLLLGIVLAAGVIATSEFSDGTLSISIGVLMALGGAIAVWASYALMPNPREYSNEVQQK